MTVCIFTVMTLYASIKFAMLVSHSNPNISSHKQQNYFDSSDVIDLKENGLRFAFNVEGYIDRQVKDDPAFVKYLVRTYGKKNGVPREKILNYHKCSNNELDLFAEPSKESAAFLQQYKNGTDRHLFCIEWDQLEDNELRVWGIENDDNYQRFEFALLPCNYIHTELGDIGDTIPQNCTANKIEQMEYLSNMKVSLLVTDSFFLKNEYDEKSVQRFSKIYSE